MAARFNKGMSIESTRKLPPQSKPKEPPTRTTMNGMPGYVKTGQTKAADGLRGGKGSGPKREGPIGKRGSSGPFPKSSPGTVTRSYKSDSTGHAGRIEKMKARTSFEGGKRKSCMY